MDHDAQTSPQECDDGYPPGHGNTWVIIGGGRLGRGFLNDVADDLGLRTILFVAGQHTPHPVVDLYNKLSSGAGYRVLAAPEFMSRRSLCNYHFHIAIDTSLLIDSICSDATAIVSTSVGLGHLPRVAPYIAEGLKRRAERNLRKVTLVVCENGRTIRNESPATYLSSLIDTHLRPFGLTCKHAAVIPETVVECAVPTLPPRPSDPIYRSEGKIWIEDIEGIPGILRRSSFVVLSRNMAVVRTRKLYGYNSLHCFLSVLGYFYGEPNVQIVARSEHLQPILEQLTHDLCDAIKAEHAHTEIADIEKNSDQPLDAYTANSSIRLKQPFADTLDPISRALQKVYNGWYLNDGRILGPVRSLGLFERPWERPVLVHMLSLSLFLYVKAIDSFRNNLPFLRHAFIDNEVQSEAIDFVPLEDDTLLSEDGETLAVTEVLADDFQQLQRMQQQQEMDLSRLVRFLRRPINEDIVPVPRSCKRLTVRGVVFDLDEGLVRTEHILYEVTRDIVKEYSTWYPNHLSHEEYAKHVGHSEEAFFDAMVKAFCIRDMGARELVMEREQRFTDRMKSADRESLIKPGFRPLLAVLSRYQVHMAVHSNASRKRVDDTLQHTGLEKFFSQVRSSSDRGMRDKPDPSMLLDILASLHIDPRECIVIESSSTGVRAALNAGCYCVLVCNEYAAPELMADRKGVTLVANAQDLCSWFLQLARVNKNIGKCIDMTDEEWRVFQKWCMSL